MRAYLNPMMVLAMMAGCGATDGGSSSVDTLATSGNTSGAGGTGGDGGGGPVSAAGAGGESVGGLSVGGFTPTPVRELAGLTSITFYERTGGDAPTPYDFTVDGPELTARLDDPLGTANHDIPGASTEFYDVYYSDEEGTFDIDGSYLTISGVFGQPLPAGGGLNLAEIGLHFSNATTELGSYLASYVVLGDNAAEGAVERCIDGDLQTHTTMGNTVGTSERLRLTLGFASTVGPPR